MGGGKRAVVAGEGLVDRVVQLAENLNLKVLNGKNEKGKCKPYRLGHRLWGSKRYVDIVLQDPATRKMLGIECKFQGTNGTAEEKIPSTIEDICVWPIRGIVVFDGEGFSGNMKSYLISTGKAMELCDLENWLRLFFSLDLF